MKEIRNVDLVNVSMGMGGSGSGAQNAPGYAYNECVTAGSFVANVAIGYVAGVVGGAVATARGVSATAGAIAGGGIGEAVTGTLEAGKTAATAVCNVVFRVTSSGNGAGSAGDGDVPGDAGAGA